MSGYDPGRRLTGEQLAHELAPRDQLRTIITGDTTEAVRLLDTTARAIGQRIYRDITTAQIRTIFGTVRMIEQDTKGLASERELPMPVQRQLMMLRPKLAYQYGRVPGRDDDSRKAAMGALMIILGQAIELIGSNQAYFRTFVDFFEAILAYHRCYGGRSS